MSSFDEFYQQAPRRQPRSKSKAGAKKKPSTPFVLEELVSSAFDAPVQATRTIEREDLSEDQALVYNEILRWLHMPEHDRPRQYLTLGGYAGTGKTTIIALLAKELEEMGTHVVFASYTGKASLVLGRKLKEYGCRSYCGTLHSLLYIPNVDPQTGRVIGWVPKSTYRDPDSDKPDELLDCALIVVDEASMVGSDIWQDLLMYGKPVIAVGDHGQLPPVGKSVNLMDNPDIRLEKIHRQAEGNPILAFAQFVRQGGKPHAFRTSDPRVRFVSAFQQGGAVQTAANGGHEAAVICYMNRSRVRLNTEVRKVRGFMGPWPDPNDIVMCLRNSRPIYNGMRGTLEKVGDDYNEYLAATASIAFPDDNTRIIGPISMMQFNKERTFDDLTKLPLQECILKDDPLQQQPSTPYSWGQLGLLFDYGYAMTCHKSQGSSFRDVVVILEWMRDEDMKRRWLYTAATRAVENLIIVG